MKFTEGCERYFGSMDLYEILKISKTSSENDVRKAYYKLAMSCHPDRVSEEEKAEATEKFKLLGKIHSILSDPEKRTIYDEQGVWADEDEEMESVLKNWEEHWHLVFKQISFDDIQKLENEYKGSEEELEDIKNTYLTCKGDMDKMVEHIMFVTYDDEDRIRSIVMKLIEDHGLPSFDIFVNEPQAKRNRRMRKLKKEAEEVEIEAKKMKKDDDSTLRNAILARRQQNAESFLDALEKKYSGPKMSKKTPKKSSRGKGKK